MPEPYQQLGLIRATALEFDAIKPEEVIARLQPLAKPGEPWFGAAAELTAMAYLKQGRKDAGGEAVRGRLPPIPRSAGDAAQPGDPDRRNPGRRCDRAARRNQPAGMIDAN